MNLPVNSSYTFTRKIFLVLTTDIDFSFLQQLRCMSVFSAWLSIIYSLKALYFNNFTMAKTFMDIFIFDRAVIIIYSALFIVYFCFTHLNLFNHFCLCCVVLLIRQHFSRIGSFSHAILYSCNHKNAFSATAGPFNLSAHLQAA